MESSRIGMLIFRLAVVFSVVAFGMLQPTTYCANVSAQESSASKADIKTAEAETESSSLSKPAEAVEDEAAPQAEAEVPAKSAAKRSSASLLPTTTRLWVSVEDLNRLEVNLSNTQLGKLARKDTLAPFFASFEKQIRETLDNNGVKFGMDLASIETLETGEISIAGVLPNLGAGAKPVRGSHGVVVLIDVLPDPGAASDFLADASDNMTERGAKLEKMQINGTDVSKWSFEVEKAKIARTQYSFVTVSEGWLLASDNESIFRKVLSRIKSDKPEDLTGSLAGSLPFLEVQKQTKVDGIAPDLRWFLDPIGYARLADALAEDKAEVRQLKDRPLETLSKEGLDALKAAGGFVSFSTGKHEVLHRTMIYSDSAVAKSATQKRLLALLDFAPAGVSVDVPPIWVPADAAGYFTASWDVQKAYTNIGHFVDAFSGKETFDDVIKAMKEVPDFRVDIKKMVQSLGNRMTVVSATEEPIDETSEKMIVGIPLADGVDGDWLIESIGRAVKGKVKKLAGFKYIVDDRVEVADDDPYGDLDIDEGIEDDLLDDTEIDDDDDADEEPPRITLFNRRYFVIQGNTLFVCNDKDYLKKVLTTKATDAFQKAADLKNMNLHLAELSDVKQVRFRMFNRLDRMLKTNYEMMRQGRMADSETFVARLMNQIYGKKASGESKKRAQQIDGSELPKDFDKEIAPYLGQSGWVMETTKSGWRFSGCVLPKKADAKKKASDAGNPVDAEKDAAK